MTPLGANLPTTERQTRPLEACKEVETAGEDGKVAARMADMDRGVNQHTQICVPTKAQAADKLNVSERTVNTAKAVQRTGTPGLIEAVTRISHAYHVDLPCEFLKLHPRQLQAYTWDKTIAQS